MTDEGYVLVFRAETEVDVVVFRALLEEAGIPVVVKPAGEAWARIYFGESHGSAAEIFVPVSSEPLARMLLKDYQAQVEQGAFELDEENGDGDEER